MKKYFKIEIEERAKIEISDAFDWYDNQQLGLGLIFLSHSKCFHNNTEISEHLY